MVDYALWAQVPLLTIRQAAHLWAGLDPDKLYSGEASRKFQLRQRIIGGAIESKTLPATYDYGRKEWRIARSDLRAFAESRSERPLFLFYEELQREAAARAANGPRRITQAPPPIPTVHDFVRGAGRPEPISRETSTAPKSASDLLREAAAWLAVEVGERIRTGRPRDRDTMVIALRGKFPGLLTKDQARKLFSELPKGLQGKTGPRPGSRKLRRPAGSGDSGPV
jgi:hypothetical protein